MTVDYLQCEGKQHDGASVQCKLDFANFDEAMEFINALVEFGNAHRSVRTEIDFVPMGA